MKLLMHICCGPCATYPAKTLLDAGHEVDGFFYNPNIHPMAEFRLRLDSARETTKRLGMPFEAVEQYDVEQFFRAVAFRESERCAACYHLRLDAAARSAAERGFDAFTASLLVSPYQKHELIRDIGQSVGIEHGVEFYYEDFRPGWQKAREMSRDMELYRQKYCGCIFSERERLVKVELDEKKARRQNADA